MKTKFGTETTFHFGQEVAIHDKLGFFSGYQGIVINYEYTRMESTTGSKRYLVLIKTDVITIERWFPEGSLQEVRHGTISSN